MYLHLYEHFSGRYGGDSARTPRWHYGSRTEGVVRVSLSRCVDRWDDQKWAKVDMSINAHIFSMACGVSSILSWPSTMGSGSSWVCIDAVVAAHLVSIRSSLAEVLVLLATTSASRDMS
jgi:hypothetical protein